jgi:hypothetical protein
MRPNISLFCEGCNMFGGFKPGWLYEPLPYIYLVVGLAAAAALHSALGIASGCLLIGAGFRIWQMRRTNRIGFTAGAITIYGERELAQYATRRIFTQ